MVSLACLAAKGCSSFALSATLADIFAFYHSTVTAPFGHYKPAMPQPQLLEIRHNKLWVADPTDQDKPSRELSELILVCNSKEYEATVTDTDVSIGGKFTTQTVRCIADESTKSRGGLELLLSLPTTNPLRGLTEIMLQQLNEHNQRVDKKNSKGGDLFNQEESKQP
jgi:hypothetical protein